MREQDLFVAAERALKDVVDQVGHDEWGQQMPADFATQAEGPVTLRRVINYHAYDDAWVPDILAGRTMEEAGKDKFDGDLLGEDPKGNFARYADTACAAVESLDDTDLDRVTHLSYGEFPAREYLWHISTFRGLRAYDLARVLGIRTKLPDDLVRGLWEMLQPHVEEWSRMGIFGPQVEVPAEAPLQDRLLGLTGRAPERLS